MSRSPIASQHDTAMTVSRERQGPARLLQLPEAPVFHPTEQEFADPLRYIAGIRAQAEPYGLCRVVPPAGWAPPFAIDRQALHFRSLVQQVHELQESETDPVVRSGFLASFAAFEAAKGSPLKKTLTVSNQDIDLCSLFRMVSRRGGYYVVTETKAWREIGVALKVGPSLPGMLRSVPSWARRRRHVA